MAEDTRVGKEAEDLRREKEKRERKLYEFAFVSLSLSFSHTCLLSFAFSPHLPNEN